MIRAKYNDKKLVVDILAAAFEDNKSVNYIIKQDDKRKTRTRSLMEYSFDNCYHLGEVFLSDDKNACALILYPDKRKWGLKSLLLDLKLLFSCIGLSNLKKASNRESAIKKLQPKGLIYYLWFIGVDPAEQGKGIGTKLMNEIIKDSESKQRLLCLETSTLKNIPWYKKFGFEIYDELDFGYTLFFLKKLGQVPNT